MKKRNLFDELTEGFDALAALAANPGSATTPYRTIVSDLGGKRQTDERRAIMGMREDYQALMEKQLNEWKVQTERFKAGAEHFEAQAKAQFEKNLELLRAKQAEAWDHFHQLKAANESAWAQFKTHLDSTGAEVKAAVERMTKHLKP